MRSLIATAGLWASTVLAGGVFLLWKQATEGVVILDLPVVLLALVPATISYLLRLLRWHVLLRQVGGSVPLHYSLWVQAIGFALAATPGRVGELLKFYLLERRCRLPATRASSVLVIERLSDAGGLAVVALFGGLLLTQQLFANGVTVHYLVAAVGVLILGSVMAKRAWKLPRVAAGRSRWWASALAEFLSANRTLLSSAAVPSALGLTVFARLCDALTIYVVAGAVDVSLSYPQAALVLGTAGLAGGVSLLPGGLGAAEAAMAGLLVGFGATATVGLLITLVVRVFTYWLWVAAGLGMLAASWRGLTKGETDAHLTSFDSPQGAEWPDRRVGGTG